MLTRTRLIGLLAAVGLAVAPAGAQTLDAPRLTVGGALLPPVDTSVRLDGLGTSGGTLALFTDTDGDVFERILGKSDLPATVGYTDEAETWSQLQTFSSGGTSLSSWLLSSTVPQLRWYESDQTSGERLWIALANDKDWMLRAYSDDGGTSTPIITADRGSGLDVTGLTLHPRTYLGEHLYPLTGYVSDLASPSAKMRTLHAGELFIETIVAQERIATMGGRFTVTPSNVLTRDIDASTTTVCVKYNSFLLYQVGVEFGSKIWLEKGGQFEVMLVENSSTPTVDGTFGDYCYTVSRNADGSGANSWAAGDGIIDTGKTGSGMIDQFAVRGLTSATIEGPSIDFLTRTSGTWNALSPRVSIGNLNGRYGISTDTWGMAAGDPAGANLLAVSDSVRLRHGTTDVLELDGTTGDITSAGDIILGTGGNIRGGATAYGTGTGFWIGDDGGTYKLRVGETVAGGNDYLAWSGAALTVSGGLISQGGILIESNSGGGNSIATSLSDLRIINTNVSGTLSLSSPSGIQVSNSGGSGTGFSGTKTVRASGGASDCTLVYISGLLTGGTC